MRTLNSVRGVERATARNPADELVPTTVNGRSEMLPDDPMAVAKILSARRQKKTPAENLRAKIRADLRRRGH